MKTAKTIGICLAVFFMLAHISGCAWFTYHYEFGQEVDNIANVDICRYKYDEYTPEMTVICTLDKSLIKQLATDISALDSYKYFGDFSHTFDGVLIFITYENGEGEVLSAYTTANVDSSGEWRVRVDHFDKREFYSIILKYVNPALVPELENT